MSDQKTIQEQIQERIGEIESRASGGGYIFRGETKCFPEVSSKLWRKYRTKTGEPDIPDIEEIQKKMLAAAKKHYSGNSDDFTILTEIQHYGGHTNLIDFTRDYRIALFFACDGNYDDAGRVVLLKEKLIKRDVKTPQSPLHRVIAQKSVFLEPPMGYIEPKDKEIVEIPDCLKKPIQKYLEDYHGIVRETIYNDLHGFIISEDHHEDAEMKLNRGIACYDDGKYDDAIEHYGEAIQRDKYFKRAYVRRADAYAAQDDHDTAINDYSEAIKIDPDDADAYFKRGAAYAKKGDLDAAIEDYSEAIKIDPKSADAHNGRGAAYVEKGDLDAAIKDYSEAIKIDPKSADAYFKRGYAYAKKDNFDAAITDYTKSIELHPNNANGYNNRGNVYKKIGSIEKAIADYDKAIEMKPDHVPAYYNRARAYENENELGKAIDDYGAAINLAPDIPVYYCCRGIVYAKQGNLHNAIADHNKAIELDPNNSWSHFSMMDVPYQLGIYHLKNKEWEKAKSHLASPDLGALSVPLTFQSEYGSVEEFEQKFRVQLPDDIKEMLTPNQ